MFKRLELHNHTTESDASLTVRDLIDFMLLDQVDAFAITDHNTISGHRKAKAILEREKLPIECIYGMEYTTYYGHILCLNLNQYISWENIDLNKPEKLFSAVHEKGALCGIAHPYSYGAPFARGCGWDMTVHDYDSFDFIEIFNNPEPLHEVNEKGFLWWEKLVLNGHRLAMTTGMDLHGRWNMAGHYATYVECEADEPIAFALDRAVHTQKTYVSKGPVFGIRNEGRYLVPFLADQVKPGFVHDVSKEYLVCYRTVGTETVKRLLDQGGSIAISEMGDPSIVTASLYEGDTEIEHLTAIAPAIYRLCGQS